MLIVFSILLQSILIASIQIRFITDLLTLLLIETARVVLGVGVIQCRTEANNGLWTEVADVHAYEHGVLALGFG